MNSRPALGNTARPCVERKEKKEREREKKEKKEGSKKEGRKEGNTNK
jgi:hypothetical protein